jgi:hypothetical protein
VCVETTSRTISWWLKLEELIILITWYRKIPYINLPGRTQSSRKPWLNVNCERSFVTVSYGEKHKAKRVENTKWTIYMFCNIIVIKSFRETQFVVEICAILGYYAVWSGNPLPTFRDSVSVASSRVKKFMIQVFIHEDGTVTLSRNVGKGLPLHTA